MTRVIGGRARSIALEVPRVGTRPTSDRVRESLFGVLESAGAVAGATVVDLYAGSGALGLEALSRGAASVELVESAVAAAAAARRNAGRVARAMDTAGEVAVRTRTVTAFLAAASGPYDLAFLDPPYDIPPAELASALDALAPLLHPDATVVVERAARSGAPPWPLSLLEVRHKRYGDTAVWWAQPAPRSQSR